jgi:hypothetical protein
MSQTSSTPELSGSRSALMTWTGTLTALSSIAHGGETRGTSTLLRRELIVLPDGQLVHVPIVSGNGLRGRLRRIGEELLRGAVGYEGLLAPAAAHALRGGGSLAKAGEPLSGSRLQRIRRLVPQVGVFGAAAGGTIIDGALDVGKVIPHVTETNHLTGASALTSAFSSTQLEAYTRQDDADGHDFVDVAADAGIPAEENGAGRVRARSADTSQMLFHIETFPAGTVFTTWLRLRWPTPLEAAFLADILRTFGQDGRLGGRVGMGHGQVRVNLTCAQDAPTGAGADWRTFVTEHRAEIIDALQDLT